MVLTRSDIYLFLYQISALFYTLANGGHFSEKLTRRVIQCRVIQPAVGDSQPAIRIQPAGDPDTASRRFEPAGGWGRARYSQVGRELLPVTPI